jgi:serine/threonine-protein kinase
VAALIGGGVLFVPGVLPTILGSALTPTPGAQTGPPTATSVAAAPTTAPTVEPTAAPAGAPTAKPSTAEQKPAVPTATIAPKPQQQPTAAPAKPEAKPEPPTAVPPTPAPPPPAPPPLPTRITAQDGAEMVLVPAGEFLMGQDGEAPTGPRFSLTLPAYYVDLTEVTNARFEKFVQETGSTPEGDWRRYFDAANFDPAFYDVERNDHPVVNVTWKDADSYCRWAGKRLPFEAEWEKAARGTDGRRWPWGNEAHPEFANVENQTEGEPDTKRVGSFPRGASLYGILDMTGNAREWTDSSLLPYPLTQTVGGAEGATSRVTRGGSWLSLPSSIELTRRLAEPTSIAAKDLGFRCAVSADQARGR